MNEIEKARKVMKDAFDKDPDFRHGYVSNIAMLLHDKYGSGNYISNYMKRNQAAEDILDLLFSS